jgi:hypothetical protein
MRPNYGSTLWRRAWKDTWDLVVGFPLASILITGVVAGLSIYMQHRPWNETKEAILNLTVGIASTAIVFLAVFLFHLLVRSPKHLYVEANARAEAVQTQLDKLTAPRPDFFYEGIGSEVTPQFKINPADGKPIVQINFLLRFKNKGEGTAYNLSSKIYACWINDKSSKAELADSTQPSVGRTRPDEAKSLGFLAWQHVRDDSELTVKLNVDDVLLILVEIRFRLGSQPDSPVCDNEPIWKMWDPRIPMRLCDANESNVRIAQEQINRLKAKLAA